MQTKIWNAMREEPKIYGMPILGVVCAGIGCFLVLLFIGLMWSAFGAVPGYFLGNFFSKSLHDGKAQRFIHWYFPRFRKSKLPNSSIKYFF